MQWNTILISVLVTAGSSLALVLAWFAVKYRSLIAKKIESERAKEILVRLGDSAFQVVGELNQTTVDTLKASGKWDTETAKKVKADALAKLKSYLGAKGVSEVMEILGIDNPTLEAMLGTLIEAAVERLKKVI